MTLRSDLMKGVVAIPCLLLYNRKRSSNKALDLIKIVSSQRMWYQNTYKVSEQIYGTRKKWTT